MTAIQNSEPEPLAGIVARRARGLMAEQRLTQADMCLRMGLSRTVMSDRLRGVKDFDLNELPALAGALRTTVEYLLGFTDVRDSKNPRPGDLDGGDSRDVRHVGLEPTTRWLTTPTLPGRAAERHLRLIPGFPIDDEPSVADAPETEREPAARVVSLDEHRASRRLLRILRGA